MGKLASLDEISSIHLQVATHRQPTAYPYTPEPSQLRSPTYGSTFTIAASPNATHRYWLISQLFHSTTIAHNSLPCYPALPNNQTTDQARNSLATNKVPTSQAIKQTKRP